MLETNQAGQEYPTLRIQVYKNKKLTTKQWSLQRHDWKDSFDHAVEILLKVKGIKRSDELDKKIVRARKFYNPNVIDNWT